DEPRAVGGDLLLRARTRPPSRGAAEKPRAAPAPPAAQCARTSALRRDRLLRRQKPGAHLRGAAGAGGPGAADDARSLAPPRVAAAHRALAREAVTAARRGACR